MQPDVTVWDRIIDWLPLWIGSAIVSSIIGVIFTLVFRRLRILKAMKAEEEEAERQRPKRPLTDWKPDELARTFLARNLLEGFAVAEGTHLLVLDRGVRQPLELKAGEHVAREVAALFRKHNVGRDAQVLQYVTIPAKLARNIDGLRSRDHVADIQAAVEVWVRVDEDRPERILEWHVAADGVVRHREIDELIWGGIEDWLRSAVGRRQADELSAATDELEADLGRAINALLGDHGVDPSVRALTFSSQTLQEQADARAAAEQRRRQAASTEGT